MYITNAHICVLETKGHTFLSVTEKMKTFLNHIIQGQALNGKKNNSRDMHMVFQDFSLDIGSKMALGILLQSLMIFIGFSQSCLFFQSNFLIIILLLETPLLVWLWPFPSWFHCPNMGVLLLQKLGCSRLSAASLGDV